MYSRTDLALELAESVKHGGIKRSRRAAGGCTVTEITVETDEAGRELGRGAGRYITIELPDLEKAPHELTEEAAVISAELRRLFGGRGSALVAGLGNADITPDALGPKTAARILATRHLRRELAEGSPLRRLSEVSAITPGVLGQTGVETAELIKAVAAAASPGVVIAVDALACAGVERLGRTVQLTDTGIFPGSGVNNSRKELSERTLGVRTIAVGVPTVIDLHTAMRAAGAEPPPTLPNMMVTPKNIDGIIEKCSVLLSLGINMALQPTLSAEEITALCL